MSTTVRGVPHVVSLTCFPVKGCAGVQVAESAVVATGLEHDRTFMVTDADGDHRTQRGSPRLATVRPEVLDGGARLRLSAPGVEPIEIAVDAEGPPRPVRLFHHDLTGVDQGGPVAGWLGAVLGGPSRLVRVPPRHERLVEGVTNGTAGYADSGAVLVTSTASQAELEHRMRERGIAPVPADRFRANVVVEGFDAPHAEDDVAAVAIGTAGFGFLKLAVRCVVVTVDQRHGERAGAEPLRTLATYRRGRGGPTFGAKFSVVRPGRVAVGDELRFG